jgi:hypothetical protein
VAIVRQAEAEATDEDSQDFLMLFISYSTSIAVPNIGSMLVLLILNLSLTSDKRAKNKNFTSFIK